MRRRSMISIEDPTEVTTCQKYRVVLATREHNYVFDCTPETRQEMLRCVGMMAADPDLDFNWHDAAQVTLVIRDIVPDCTCDAQLIAPHEPVDWWLYGLLACCGTGFVGVVIWAVKLYGRVE